MQALAALYRRLDGASEVDRMEVAGYLAGNLQSFRDAWPPPRASRSSPTSRP